MPVRNLSPSLTAVIPVTRLYGKLKNLKATLEQAEGFDIKFIIVHDIQDNRTGPGIDALLKEIQPKNLLLIEGFYGSPGASRNAGLKLVETKWVTFWDGDDVGLARNFCEIVEAASKEDARIAIGSYAITDFNNDKILQHRRLAANSDMNLHSIAVNPGLWRFAFQVSSLKNIEFKSWKLAEDQDFLIQTEFWKHKYKTFDKVVYRYSLNVQGQLTQKYRSSSELEISIENVFDLLRQKSSPLQTREFLEIIALRQVISCLKFSRNPADFSVGLRYFVILISKIKIRVIRLLFKILRLSRDRKTSKVTIYLQGGLGNNLFQIVAAESLIHSEFRVLVWKSDLERMRRIMGELETYYQGEIHVLRIGLIRRLLNLSMRISLGATDASKKKLQPAINAFLNFYFSVVFRQRTRIFFSHDIGWSSLQRMGPNNLLVGYFQSFKYSSLDSDSHFGRDCLKGIRNNEKSWTNLAKVEVPLVVHLRLGDYRAEPTFGIPSPTYYAEAIKELFNSGEFNKIWLFSDEVSIAQKYIPSELQSFVRIVEGPSLDPLTTLAIMTLGSGYVIGNSTFGWWGAFLKANDTAPVIAPSKWFSGMSDPLDILPSEWLLRDPDFEKGWKAITSQDFLWKDTGNEIK